MVGRLILQAIANKFDPWYMFYKTVLVLNLS